MIDSDISFPLSFLKLKGVLRLSTHTVIKTSFYIYNLEYNGTSGVKESTHWVVIVWDIKTQNIIWNQREMWNNMLA